MKTRPVNGRVDAAAARPARLRRALAASQRRLDAALREILALLKQDSLIKQKVALLEQEIAQTRQFAYHDPLTGLPNRRLLVDRFNQAVSLAARQHKQVALLFLDLDDFKRVNDGFGHMAGDRILQQVAARLVACIRTSDTACRFGGDEFVILLPELEGQEGAFAVAEKLRAHLATPYVIDGTEFRLTASIGMAVYPVDGHDCGDLVQVSDRAMYRSKARVAAAPGDAEAALQARRRPAGIEETEEHWHASRQTETDPIEDEVRSHAGRSVQ